MKKGKKWFVYGCGILCLFGFVLCYQPIKENHPYQREVEDPVESLLKDSDISEEKLVQKAKESFENLLHIEIDETDYLVQTSIGSPNYLTYDEIKTARIAFHDPTSNDMVYSITYDASTGEVLELYSAQEVKQTEQARPEAELTEIAKDFLTKMMEDEDILPIGEIRGDTYFVSLETTSQYERVYLYINIYDGTVMLFQKYKVID